MAVLRTVIIVAKEVTGYVSSTVRDVLRASGVGAVFCDGHDGLLWDLRLPKPLKHPISTG